MGNRLIRFIFLTAFIVFASCMATPTSEAEIQKTADSAFNQAHEPDLSGIYAKAIRYYINAVQQKDSTVLDTVFFIKRKNGQPDDFPDIQLPRSVNQTQLILLTQQQADDHKHNYRASSPCINLVGWVENQKAEFVFVAFYPGYTHQSDCHIQYKFNPSTNDFNLEKLTIDVLIYDSGGNPDHYAVYQDGRYTGDKPLN